MKLDQAKPQPRALWARGLCGATLALLTMSGCSSSSPDGAAGIPTTPSANTAPAVLNIGDLSGPQDVAIGPVTFNVSDNESNPSELVVTAQAADAKLFPSGTVVLTGAGGERQVLLTPAEEQVGATTLTVTVRDPQGAATTRSIAVAVRAVPASIRSLSTGAFAKGENEAPAAVNGFTFADDANDPAAFDALLATGAQ